MLLQTRTALPLLVLLGGCVQPELLNENITGQSFPLPMPPSQVGVGHIKVNSFNNQIVSELTNFLTTGATPLGVNVIATVNQPPPLFGSLGCLGAGACLRGVHYNPSRRPLLLDDLVTDASTSVVGGSFIATGAGFEIASSAFDFGVPLDAFDAVDAFGSEVAFHLRLPPNRYPQFQYKERFATDVGGNPVFPSTPPFDPTNPAAVATHLLAPHEGIKELLVGLVVPLEIVPADPFDDQDPNDPPGTTLPAPTPWIQDFTCDCDGIGGPMLASHPIIDDACSALDDFMCLPFGPFFDTCDKVTIHLKVNQIPVEVGLRPTLPAQPLSDVTWPALTGDSEPIVRSKLFDLEPFIASVPSVASYMAPQAVDADVTHDIAFSVDTECGVMSGAHMQVVAQMMNYATINDVIRGFAQPRLQAEVGARLASTVEPRIAEQLAFDDPLPPPCMLPQGLAPQAGECGVAQTRDMLRASTTYALWNAFYSAFGPYQNGGVLQVTAITDAPFGGAPKVSQAQAELTFHFDEDEDGDGVITPTDNCPFVKNELQFDHDGDGAGDLCDPCPWDQDNDSDGDGLCANSDNCPLAYNLTQSNCNANAEAVQQAEVRGDACDPTPCASAAVEWETFEEGDLEELECPKKCTEEDKLNGKCHPLCPETKPYDFYMLCAETDTVRVELRPNASHGWSGLTSPVAVPNVATEVRFCAKNPQLGITCVDPAVDFFEDQMLAESSCWDPNPLAPTACADPEMPEDHYRRMTFAAADQGNGTDPNGVAASVDYDRYSPYYGEPTESWQWKVTSDFDRWTIGTTLPLIGDSAATNMVGTVWVTGDTPVGASLNVGTGIHGASLDNAQLANHHNLGWNGTGIDLGWMLDPCTVCVPKPVPLTLDDDVTDDGTMGGSYGPAPAPAPSPYVVWPTERRIGAAHPLRRMNAGPGASHFLLAHAENLTVLNDQPECGGQPAEDRVSDHVRELFALSDVGWASASDLSVHAGLGERFPFAVALAQSEDGVAVVGSLVTDGATIQDEAEVGVCGADFATGPACSGCSTGACTPEGCCVAECRYGDDCASGVCEASSGTCVSGLAGEGPPVVNAVPILSRARGGLFLVGGYDVTTAEPSAAIWFRSQLGGSWTAMRPGIPYDHVLAATFHAPTDELVILMQHDSALTGLWAVDVRTQAVRELGYFGRNPQWDRIWLVPDVDGSLLLVTARSEWNKDDEDPAYMIASMLVKPLDGLVIQGRLFGHDELLAPPVVDAYGYQLPIKREREGDWTTAIDQRSALEMLPATPDQIAQYL